MSTAILNERKYRVLLDRALPVVVQNDKEYHRLLGAVEELMEKPEEEMTPEEGRFLELLAVLIEEYEDRVHPLPKT